MATFATSTYITVMGIFNFSPFSVIMALIIIAIATVCSHD